MILTDSTNHKLPPCVATIGCFDGVHRGHRYLIRQVSETAKREGLCSALITFPVHPRQVMHADYQPQLLSCLKQKRRAAVFYKCRLLPDASIHRSTFPTDSL